ncbi:YihY/virulence factor BrkB family protein [Bartonella sp. DGB1]|uniref:YihY/virulence factor BrkB family protein n=1 Tax=Bartonella sp. DGB1 TaxID=3239807 RepID=UPI003524BE50
MLEFFKKLFKVFRLSIINFLEDEGFVYASHLAFSCLLALFPFLIFVTSLASSISWIVGAENLSQFIVGLIFDNGPQEITAPISQEIYKVLSKPESSILTLSILATLYFAASGVDALRVALNRAYGLIETRSWLFLRVQHILFIVIFSLFLVFFSLLFIIMPCSDFYLSGSVVLQYLNSNKSTLALLSLILGILFSHIFLPNQSLKLLQIIPGIIVSFILWGIGSYCFILYLKNLANYFSTYAGLASIVIVMIFLYLMGLIFIYGAEFNSALISVFKYNKDKR